MAVPATLIATLFLAILFPSLGRLVVDKSTTPPTIQVVDLGRSMAFVVAIVGVPLMSIVYGAFSGRSAFYMIGWGLLFVPIAYALLPG